MLLSGTLFVVLSYVHQSLQQGITTQMRSASYKNIEVEYDSWIKASLYKNKTLLPVGQRFAASSRSYLLLLIA